MPKTDLKIIVDSHLWLPMNKSLPEEVIDHLEEALTFETLEYLEALEHDEPTDGIEQFYEMFDYDDNHMVLPRGFAWTLVDGLNDLGITYSIDDRRQKAEAPQIGNEIELFDYQETFVETLLETEQGIGIAPTGAGKTVAILEILRRSPGRSIVIVNTKEIADQWMQRCQDFLGDDYPVSMVGDGQFEVSDYLTVALQPTLWKRRDKLRADGFFDLFRNCVLDECHHVTAETYNQVIGEFSSQLRFGVSATPRKTGDFRLAESVLGPVVVEITDDDVSEKTMKPKVEVIETKFGIEQKKRKQPNSWARRADYEQILKALTEDGMRNRLIAREIVENWSDGHANLVLSKRLDHLSNIWEHLVAEGYDPNDIVTIVGMNKRLERRAAVKRVEKGNVVVLSTLADEALDAPRLDVVHLCWPTKNPDLVLQQVGRIRRRHPEKAACYVIDYHDKQVKTLNNQYMTRRHDVYNKKGWEVTKRKGTDRG